MLENAYLLFHHLGWHQVLRPGHGALHWGLPTGSGLVDMSKVVRSLLPCDCKSCSLIVSASFSGLIRKYLIGVLLNEIASYRSQNSCTFASCLSEDLLVQKLENTLFVNTACSASYCADLQVSVL